MSTRFRFPRKTRAFLFGLIPLLTACEKTPVPVDPGRVTLHRLNRDEYDNTVRDLLGTSQRPAQQFPSDDSGYGFDNVAQVLSVSAPHVERYLRAAESLIVNTTALIVAVLIAIQGSKGWAKCKACARLIQRRA